MAKKFTPAGSLISKKIGRAIGTYNMIEDGDTILVGISGGKDSLTLLDMLAARQSFAPVRYAIHAVHIQPQFNRDHDLESYLTDLFEKLGVPYTIDHMDIEVRSNKSNCFWCSWNRRKKMFDLAESLGFKKIALGHHKDDIIETTLLNMFFIGDFSTMNPVQEFFNGSLHIIRPLVYCEEKEIAAYAAERDFNDLESACQYKGNSKRQVIKDFIAMLEEKSPQVKTNIFKSMSRINQEYIDLRE